eukprot:1819794-Amphidinium_carterae.1
MTGTLCKRHCGEQTCDWMSSDHEHSRLAATCNIDAYQVERPNATTLGQRQLFCWRVEESIQS